jgi:predicted transcriptional regulator YdeE
MKSKTISLLVTTIFVITCFIGFFTSLYATQNHFNQEDIMKDYTVIQKPSINVIGIECRTSNAPKDAPQDIPRLWGQFYSEDIINKIPNKASNEVIALYCDYEGDYTQPYSLVIGCSVTSLDSIPEGMVAKIIPAGSYAVFRAIGEYPATLIETWGNIWQTKLNRTYTGDYEFYGEKFSSGSSQEVEVYIAIEKETSNDN